MISNDKWQNKDGLPRPKGNPDPDVGRSGVQGPWGCLKEHSGDDDDYYRIVFIYGSLRQRMDPSLVEDRIEEDKCAKQLAF